MTTNTFIMAVPWWPKRAVQAKALAEQTGGTVVWDTEHSIMDTWRKTMRAAGDEAGIFLEDDVILTDDWRTKIEAVIAEHPTEVIQFFALDPRKYSKAVRGRSFMSTCCYYLPPDVAWELLAFAEGWEDKYTHISMKMGTDRVIGEWLESRGETYWHHVPSLVQHRDGPSMVDPKRDQHSRQADDFS